MNIHFTNRICSWWSTKGNIPSHVLAVLITVNDAKVQSENHSSVYLIPSLSLSVAAEFASLCCCCCCEFLFFFVPYESPNSVPGKRGVIWGGNVCFLVCYHLFHFVLKRQGVELGRRLHLRSQKSQTVTRFWVYRFIFKVKKSQNWQGSHFSGQSGIVSEKCHIIWMYRSRFDWIPEVRLCL